mgnify:CR=1 FL=1
MRLLFNPAVFFELYIEGLAIREINVEDANTNEEQAMNMSHISLKWLEVFHLVACHGSVQAAAREAGLSISTVSHHLRSLEAGDKLTDICLRFVGLIIKYQKIFFI